MNAIKMLERCADRQNCQPDPLEPPDERGRRYVLLRTKKTLGEVELFFGSVGSLFDGDSWHEWRTTPGRENWYEEGEYSMRPNAGAPYFMKLIEDGVKFADPPNIYDTPSIYERG